MTSSLELAKATVAGAPPGVSPFPSDYLRNGTSYCQTFAGNYWESAKGRNTPNSYASAQKAYEASSIVSMDWNLAPPGAYHYFKYGTAGHVGVALGSGMMASGTGWGTNAVEHLGKHVYVHRVADYAAHLTYLGWAYTNGNREQITGLTDPYAVPTKPNQRKTTVETRRRVLPTRDAAYDGNANLAPGTVVTPDGWISGEQIDGTQVWFVIGGFYSHSSCFSDREVHDLAEMNSYPDARTVLTGIANGSVRRDASTQAEKVGIVSPGEVVRPIKRWKRGEQVTSGGRTTDVWFEVPRAAGQPNTDPLPFSWAGSYTDPSTNGLTEITPDPQPEPIDYTRKVVGTQAVNVRRYPTTTATIVGSLPLGAEVEVRQYTLGDVVTSAATGVTTDIWYVTTGGVAWAGAFDSQSVEGLEHLDITEPDQQYPDAPYTFVTDLPGVVDRVVPADWSNFENEWSQPDPTLRKGFPLAPTGTVRHQWGAPGQFSLESVLNTIKGRHLNSADKVGVQFVVGINTVTKAVEIIQCVQLGVRAYHAGAGGNDLIGIEIDPRMTPEVIAAVRRLESALADKYGYRLVGNYHQDLPGANTACGQYIKPYAADLDAPFPGDDDEDPEFDIEVILAAVAASTATMLEAVGKVPTADENGAAARRHIVAEEPST